MNKPVKFTLKMARLCAGLTQEKAASLIGVSPDTLSNYERGKSFPDVVTVKKIEQAYGIGYNDLIFLPEDYGLTVIESGKPRA